MARQDVNFYALNRGEVSALALGRVDNQALRLAAEVQRNWLPRVLGPMMFRPGTQFVGSIQSDQKPRMIPFIFSATDTALIELTPNIARFWVNDALVTRPTVATVMHDFVTGEWVTTVGPTSSITVNGFLEIENVRQNSTTKAVHAMSVATPDQSKEHGLEIVVDIGPIEFRIGTSSGGQQVFSSKQLQAGRYHLAFTPDAATVYIQFSSTDTLARRLVSFIGLDPPGILTMSFPFLAPQLPLLTYDQSADQVFVACEGEETRIISRYSVNGWALIKYLPSAGPFPASDGDKGTQLTPAATRGTTTISSNVSFFKSAMVGHQIRLFDDSDQTVSATVINPGSFTETVRVNGVARNSDNGATKDRQLFINISGTWTGTINLQRSYTSATEGFSKVLLGGPSGSQGDFTANEVDFPFDDDLQNVICWYRLGVDATKTITGSAVLSIRYPKGSGYGYARITSVGSSSSATVEILKSFPNANKVAKYWRLSEWSDENAWPSVVRLHEGRLWFASAGRIFGSVSDQYFNFDDAVIGDSGPINRSIGSGPITNIRWLLSSWRLVLGGDTSILSCRSDSLDTPLTPTVFNIKTVKTIGTGTVQPVIVDMGGFYIEQSGRRVLQLNYAQNTFVEQVADATRLNLEIGVPGFVEMAVMRQPDTRLYLVRKDGQMAVLLTEIDEEAAAWCRMTTDGAFENVVCLPGILETKVYVVVRRTINGVTRRYLERFARMDECQGGTLTKCIDCHAIYTGAPVTIITGLTWLEGKSVVVWGDGRHISATGEPEDVQQDTNFIVTGGQIVLPVAVSNAVVGLSYTATFKSAKLAYHGPDQSTAINKVKRIDHIGMLLSNTHYQGIRYGTDDQNYNSLPLIKNGVETPVDTIYTAYDEKAFEFPGRHDTDTRVHLFATAPRPATILGITIGMATNG